MARPTATDTCVHTHRRHKELELQSLTGSQVGRTCDVTATQTHHKRAALRVLCDVHDRLVGRN